MKLFSMFKKSAEMTPQFNDNMNYMIFEGEGIYSKTGRKRKIHIEAFSESEAIETLAAEYDPGTINISRVPFAPPSEAQISAMRKHGNKVPQKACMIDISFLISKYVEDEPEADKDLITFATKQKVKFSYYTGEKSLYRCIWNTFTPEEKFAFYLLCVERDRIEKWKFEKFDYYKSIASNYLNDDKFMNSFKRYSANDNIFYGFAQKQGVEYGYYASRNTNCYKIAVSIVS